MVITTTGIAFIISSIGLGFCGFRFFEAFQNIDGSQSNSKVGLLLSTYFFVTSIQHGIMAFGSIMFANNSEALYATLSFVNILLIIEAGLAVYMVFYILLPKWSPWPATVGVVAFSSFVAVLTFLMHPLPLLTETMSIDWNAPISLQILMNLVLLISIGSPLFIFVRNLFLPNPKKVRVIFLVLTLVHLAGVFNVTILFSRWLLGDVEFKNKIFDFILIIIGLFFLIAFLLAPIFLKSDKTKKIG